MEQALYDERKERPRYEVIGGTPKLLAQPATPHAAVAGNIHYIFECYLRGKRCKVFGEVDVFLDEENHFIPDLVIVCDRTKIKYDGIHGAPDLVVEILSPSTAKDDRTRKMQAYAKAGVREYWLASPKEKSVEVYCLSEDGFLLDHVYHDYSEEEISVLDEKEKLLVGIPLKVSLYPDLEIDVREVFRDTDFP